LEKSLAESDVDIARAELRTLFGSVRVVAAKREVRWLALERCRASAEAEPPLSVTSGTRVRRQHFASPWKAALVSPKDATQNTS